MMDGVRYVSCVVEEGEVGFVRVVCFVCLMN